jgi:ribosomal protein S8
MARHDFVLVPSSTVKLAIAKILKGEGFINGYEVLRDKSHRTIKIYLRYDNSKSALSQLKVW